MRKGGGGTAVAERAAGKTIPAAHFTFDASHITFAAQGRGREIDAAFFSDTEYDALFNLDPNDPNYNVVPIEDRIFVPDDTLSDNRLLPNVEPISQTVLLEIAETFSLNGDPNFSTRKICTFDDLKIATTDRKLLTFRPNQVQEDYLDVILPGWKDRFARKSPLELRGLREFILKPRKLGFSTLILALFFLDTISTPNTQTVIIAHDAATTRKLFDVMRRFYRNLHPDKQPKTGYYSRQEIWFKDIDSYIYVGTAGSGQYGRGGTVQNLHGSEAAFWPNPEDIVAGLFESVPLDGNIFVETTANGLGAWFDKTYSRSKDGETEYNARFFPWNIAQQYQQDFPEGFTPNEEEETLAATYGLNYRQLYWRRLKRAALGRLFEQEFPITDIEAFVSSGSPYFDRVLLNELYETINRDRKNPIEDRVYEPLSPKDTTLSMGGYKELFRELLRVGKNGIPNLCIWEPPIPGVLYAIGADVAEGEATDDEKKDYDAAEVIRVDTMEEVAVLRGRWGNSKADYAILLAQLGFFYNEALLAVERNNHGLSVLNTLQNGRPGFEQWIYPPRRTGRGGLYYEEDLDERTNFASRMRKSKKNAQIVRKAGWYTNLKTKPLMLDYLAQMVENGLISLNAIQTVRELMTFAKKANGKSGAEGESHDDTTIALAIAVFVAQSIDRYASSDGEGIEGMGGFTASGGGRGLESGLSGLFGGSR